MADQASIFENNNGGTPPQNTPPGSGGNGQPDELTTLLANIKNERGEPKYKSVQDALKALQHSQEYIPSLKQTKDELEAKLQQAIDKANKVDVLEQTILELTQKVGTVSNTSNNGLTEEQIADLVNRTLSNAQQETVAKNNIAAVANKAKEVFGDKAEEVFYKKAEELGLTKAEFNALAAKTPQAVLKLIGADGEQRSSSNSSGFNTSGFQPVKDSMIKANAKSVLLGATSDEVVEESRNSRKLVDELHAQGKTVHDLTDPKVFFKHFK